MNHGRLPVTKPSILSSTYPFLPSTSSLSLSSSIQHYINSDNPFHGLKIHSHIIKTGYEPNLNISIKLIILYLKTSLLSYARRLFDELSQPTTSAYNYMVWGYMKHGRFEESFVLVKRMVLDNGNPDGLTFSMILKAHSNACGLQLGHCFEKQVHAQIVKSDVEADDVLFTGLVDSYVKSGRVDYARRVFDLMLEKNVVCSTSMISGYLRQGSVEDAEEIFEKTVKKDVVVFNAMIEGYSREIGTAKKAIEVFINMLRLDFRPTISTFASIIGACSLLSAFEIGLQFQGQLMKTKYFTDIKIGSALVDMFSKCGRVEEARSVFDCMPLRNVFTWTSMIDGYGKNGDPGEALELFGIMLSARHIEPNHVTFLGALSACGHAGLIEKGKQIFDSMERDYSLKPKMEHYACMVDLFGRAGTLSKALEFITRMPKKPNSDVWAALLSSSRVHGNVAMANIAANELFKLSTNDRPGAYVALSNTLADAGKWDSVSDVRETMRVRRISKDTGFSWVGTDDGLEGFHAGAGQNT